MATALKILQTNLFRSKVAARFFILKYVISGVKALTYSLPKHKISGIGRYYMKKLLSVLLVALLCASVFAVEVSVGAFSASKAQTAMGVYGQVDCFSVEKENFRFGFEAEFATGKHNKDWTGTSVSESFHNIFAARAVAEFDINKISVGAGFGVKFNGLIRDFKDINKPGQVESGKNSAALDFEVSAKYNFNEKFAAGIALDVPFAERFYVDLLCKEKRFGEPITSGLYFAPAAKVFASYNF